MFYTYLVNYCNYKKVIYNVMAYDIRVTLKINDNLI